MPNELTCKEVMGLIDQYIEKILLPEMQALFEMHLVDCPACATYFEQIQKTIRVLREQAQEPLGQMKSEQREAILRAFRNGKRG